MFLQLRCPLCSRGENEATGKTPRQHARSRSIRHAGVAGVHAVTGPVREARPVLCFPPDSWRTRAQKNESAPAKGERRSQPHQGIAAEVGSQSASEIPHKTWSEHNTRPGSCEARPRAGRVARAPHHSPASHPRQGTIYAAIPGGSRRARSQRAYLAVLLTDPELAELRADARRSVLEVARVLARWASWRTMTAWRPRARICAEVGSSRDPGRPLSVSAFKSCRRWLEDHGYLGLVEGGTTPLFRAAVLAESAEGNRCPLYVLTTPRRRCQIRKPESGPTINRPLPRSRRDLGTALRAHEASPKIKRREGPRSARTACAAARCPCPAQVPPNPQRSPGGGRRDPGPVPLTSGGLSIEHLRHLGRPYFTAGWTGADVLHAIDHDARGRGYGYAQGVRSPAAWARARLAAWLGPDGTPLPSRSQLAAAARERDQADQARRRAERRRAVRVHRGRGGRQGDAVGPAGRVARPGPGLCTSGVC